MIQAMVMIIAKWGAIGVLAAGPLQASNASAAPTFCVGAFEPGDADSSRRNPIKGCAKWRLKNVDACETSTVRGRWAQRQAFEFAKTAPQVRIDLTAERDKYDRYLTSPEFVDGSGDYESLALARGWVAEPRWDEARQRWLYRATGCDRAGP